MTVRLRPSPAGRQQNARQPLDSVIHDLGGDGLPILIVHATGFHGRSYEPLAALLRPDRQVLALDLPGHGSAPPARDPSHAWSEMTHAVSEAVRSLGTPMFLFGHSVGAAVALHAQALQGDLFTGAYVFEPAIVAAGPQPPLPDNGPSIEGARRRRATFSSLEEAMWRYASRPPLDTLCASSLASYVQYGFVGSERSQVRLRCEPDYEAAIYEQTGSITIDDIVTIDIPVVFAAGGMSTSSLLRYLPDMAANLRQGRYEVLSGVGHLGPLEHPPTIAQALQSHF